MKDPGIIFEDGFEEDVQRVGEKPYAEIQARIREHAAKGIEQLLAIEQRNELKPKQKTTLRKQRV
ncbi:MAG: hypothetical protein WCJ56_10860 [bacterium]